MVDMRHSLVFLSRPASTAALSVAGIADWRRCSPISPIKHVSAVTVPVLLIHGRDDTVVPYEQSDVMLSALKRAGKPVELITLRHEDHRLTRSETRLQMLQAIVDFLKANNPPD